MAVAGENYCIVAADTRMSTGFNIMTRNATKLCQLCVDLSAPQCSVATTYFKVCFVLASRSIWRGPDALKALLDNCGCALCVHGGLICVMAYTELIPRVLCSHRSDKCVIASAGFMADAKTLQKNLIARQVSEAHGASP